MEVCLISMLVTLLYVVGASDGCILPSNVEQNERSIGQSICISN